MSTYTGQLPQCALGFQVQSHETLQVACGGINVQTSMSQLPTICGASSEYQKTLCDYFTILRCGYAPCAPRYSVMKHYRYHNKRTWSGSNVQQSIFLAPVPAQFRQSCRRLVPSLNSLANQYIHKWYDTILSSRHQVIHHAYEKGTFCNNYNLTKCHVKFTFFLSLCIHTP